MHPLVFLLHFGYILLNGQTMLLCFLLYRSTLLPEIHNELTVTFNVSPIQRVKTIGKHSKDIAKLKFYIKIAYKKVSLTKTYRTQLHKPSRMVITMKTLAIFSISTVFLFAWTTVFAQPAIQAKFYDCAKLQQLIQSQKSIKIKGLLGATTVYSGVRSCGRYSRPVQATWRSSDQLFCTAGYVCKEIDIIEDD